MARHNPMPNGFRRAERIRRGERIRPGGKKSVGPPWRARRFHSSRVRATSLFGRRASLAPTRARPNRSFVSGSRRTTQVRPRPAAPRSLHWEYASERALVGPGSPLVATRAGPRERMDLGRGVTQALNAAPITVALAKRLHTQCRVAASPAWARRVPPCWRATNYQPRPATAMCQRGTERLRRAGHPAGYGPGSWSESQASAASSFAPEIPRP
jgi:hypothetical protein